MYIDNLIQHLKVVWLSDFMPHKQAASAEELRRMQEPFNNIVKIHTNMATRTLTFLKSAAALNAV